MAEFYMSDPYNYYLTHKKLIRKFIIMLKVPLKIQVVLYKVKSCTQNNEYTLTWHFVFFYLVPL